MMKLAEEIIQHALYGREEYVGEFDPNDPDYLYFENKKRRYEMYKFEEIEDVPEFFFDRKNKYTELYDHIINMKIGSTTKITGFESDAFLKSFGSALYHGKMAEHMRNQGCKLEKKVASDEGAIYVRKVKQEAE